MTDVIVDASVAIKWVIPEEGAEQAHALRSRFHLAAPELILAECANVLWKYVRRGEISIGDASASARLLQTAPVQLLSTRDLIETALRIADEVNHPTYDCLYLALALGHRCRLVTADEKFVRKLRQAKNNRLLDHVVRLREAVNET